MNIWVRILRWIFKLQRWAYLHRRYSLSLVAVFIVIIGSAALDVKNSNDPMLFFSDNNIHRQKLEDYREVYGKSAATLIALDAGESGAPLHMLEAERYLSQILLDPEHPHYIDHLTSLGSTTATLPVFSAVTCAAETQPCPLGPVGYTITHQAASGLTPITSAIRPCAM